MRPAAAGRTRVAGFALKVAEVVKAIPAGRVATYGQVAMMAGNPGGARQVVRALRAVSERYGLPWHRVVSSKGVVSLPGEGGQVQRARLEQEGVAFGPGGRLALNRFLWRGPARPSPVAALSSCRLRSPCGDRRRPAAEGQSLALSRPRAEEYGRAEAAAAEGNSVGKGALRPGCHPDEMEGPRRRRSPDLKELSCRDRRDASRPG